MDRSKYFSIGKQTTDQRYKVEIGSAQIKKMIEISLRTKDETGGILVGRYASDQRTAIIMDVSGPSLDSKKGRTWFLRGTRGLQSWLDKLWKGEQQYYLGEWHSHGQYSPAASSTDREQMLRIASDPKYSAPEPLLVIVGQLNKVAAINVYVALRSGEFLEMVDFASEGSTPA